jgi:hypothetical protein
MFLYDHDLGGKTVASVQIMLKAILVTDAKVNADDCRRSADLLLPHKYVADRI